jgi:hypothetical protein
MTDQLTSTASTTTPIGHHQWEDLSGTAGTGKTWLARELAHVPGVTLAATTGIAAVNLGEGTTINALLSYFDTASLREMYTQGYLQTRLRHLRRCGLRRIVLDEKSMLDGQQLTLIVRAIDEVNQGRTLEDVGGDEYADMPSAEASHPTDDEPQLALTLVGDFGQLPPVRAPFAFESAEWERFSAHRTTLTEVKRQDDQDFVHALHAVRLGQAHEALAFFTEDRFAGQLDYEFDGTTVFAKNDAIARYNQLRLDRLTTSKVSFESMRWGKERGDWKQIPERLDLKLQALVMILANQRQSSMDPEPGRLVYANGDLGLLVGVDWDEERDEDVAHVELYRTGEVVTVRMVTRECLQPLEPGRAKELRLAGLDERVHDKSEIVGEVTYMPLRCAYGTSVHKSQGLTLDKVQVNIQDAFFKQPGMLFVALSRARTASGLRLVGTPRFFVDRCTVNPVVRPWL